MTRCLSELGGVLIRVAVGFTAFTLGMGVFVAVVVFREPLGIAVASASILYVLYVFGAEILDQT